MFYKKYYPDYARMYPGVALTPEVITALRQSDRKMKYCEYDLKSGKPIYVNANTGKPTDKHDPDAIAVGNEPGREISLDACFTGGDKAVFEAIDEYSDPLEAVLKKELYTEFYRCLDLLAPEERKLIDALFFKGMNETEYAKSIGRRQSSVNEMKHRVFAKIRKNFK